MSNYDFVTVEVSEGTFIGWTEKPGQEVLIDVMSFSPDAGTDFNKNPCPRLVGTLMADCATYKNKGVTKERLTKDTVVTINAGQYDLKTKLLEKPPVPSDIVRIRTEGTVPTPAGSMKKFDVAIARGAGTGKASATDEAPAAGGGDFLDDI